eukprot:TRINITY_DN3302_c0_g1_i2.p1 TRINITY_DN3302_c0_g1~~TRINITY_DN3302_c0_g1_i2.p1  ORF type:complete len:298 (+),score=40.32 TRINITY_DN3302_c0_g1_i2:74-895(+)
MMFIVLTIISASATLMFLLLKNVVPLDAVITPVTKPDSTPSNTSQPDALHQDESAQPCSEQSDAAQSDTAPLDCMQPDIPQPAVEDSAIISTAPPQNDTSVAVRDTTAQESKARAPPRKAAFTLLMAAVVMFGDKRFLLLCPLMLGLAFFRAVYWGVIPALIGQVDVRWVGYTMAAAGACNCFGAMVFGPLADKIGSLPVICVGSIFCVASMILLACVFYLGWSNIAWYFVIIGCCAIADTISETTLIITIGTIWPKKASAFAAYHSYPPFLC